MFSASWNAPVFTTDSPMKQRQTWSPPRYLMAKPTPAASGTCPPTMPWPPRKFSVAVEHVHRAALAARAAVDAAEQLGHDGARRHAARERLPVIAVRRDDVVVRAQHRDARRCCTASWPMYRWQKPPILPNAYASAHRSSKRRCSSIERSSSRLSVGVLLAGAVSDFVLRHESVDLGTGNRESGNRE